MRSGPAAHRLYETDARIIVEVLSPSNDPSDRTARLYAHQSLRSVETILFVDPDRRVATVHQRTAGGFWGERQVTTGQVQITGSAHVAGLDFGELWQHVEDHVTQD